MPALTWKCSQMLNRHNPWLWPQNGPTCCSKPQKSTLYFCQPLPSREPVRETNPWDNCLLLGLTGFGLRTNRPIDGMAMTYRSRSCRPKTKHQNTKTPRGIYRVRTQETRGKTPSKSNMPSTNPDRITFSMPINRSDTLKPERSNVRSRSPNG